MDASASVTVHAPAATAMASAPVPGVSVAVPVPAGGARAVGFAPTAVIGPSVLLAYIVAEPHPHLSAHHDDPIAYGTEIALAAALIFVGGKLVAGRTFRL